uniref:hypothetical protein n=1 Tax=uncultured Sphingomonas sp. TaxID=158754 RepID=UPI0035CC929A
MFKDLTRLYQTNAIRFMIAALVSISWWTYKSARVVLEAYNTGAHPSSGYVTVTLAVGIGVYAFYKALKAKSSVDLRDPIRRLRAIIRRNR